jgi:hypothetical protein
MAVTYRDYSGDLVDAARSVLLELVRLLGEYRDDIVVVGGWVPPLHAQMWQTDNGWRRGSTSTCRGRQGPVTSVKDLLVREVGRLSEEEAREVLELVKKRTITAVGAQKRRGLTREDLIKRAAGRPGVGLPDPEAPPFEKFERIETRGIPASKLLIADRR